MSKIAKKWEELRDGFSNHETARYAFLLGARFAIRTALEAEKPIRSLVDMEEEVLLLVSKYAKEEPA